MIPGVGRHFLRGIVGLISVVLVSTLLPATAAQAKNYPVVPGELFGVHYHAVSDSVPNFRFGAIRLWDSGVTWARLNPAFGVYDWEPLDRAVDNARVAGATEVQYVFGVTPAWAASRPNEKGFYGSGSASAPASIEYFTTFAAALADRYRGRITSYEIWNEASLKIFFTGTAKQLANMTIQGSRTIKSVDPAAVVVSSSTTFGVFTRRPGFWKDFAKRLRKAHWPIDAVNIHPYSKKPDYLAKRVSTIVKARAFYRRYGFRGPIWDTEVNYGDRRNMFGGWKQIAYTGDISAGMVARTYVDAMRLRVPRVFWYGWDYHLFGIDMVDPATGAITQAGTAFHTVQDWMVGRTWLGCRVKKSVRSCKLMGPDGARTTIVYATSKVRTYKIPATSTTFQSLNGVINPVVPGQRIKVNAVPILVQGA